VYVFEVGNKETGDGRSGGETGMERCPRQELNLRTRVGVACDADLEAGRLRRRAV